MNFIKFKQMDSIQNLEDIGDTYKKSLGEGFASLNRNGHLTILIPETNIFNVPELTHCIDVSTDLRVKLYFKNFPVPLTEWLRQGKAHFISYLSESLEEQKKILDEFNCCERYQSCKQTSFLMEIVNKLFVSF